MKRFNIFCTLILFLATFAAAVQITPIPDVTSPKSILVSNDRIYIGEAAKIFIYSLKDFKLIKQFGKKGEGPKEFMPFPQGRELVISTHPDFLLVCSTGKISFFTWDGEFIKEIKTKRPYPFFRPQGKMYVDQDHIVEEKVRFLTLSLFDSNFKKVKEFHRLKIKPNTKIDSVSPEYRLYKVGATHTIVTVEKEFEIQCYDNNGKLVRTIKEDYKKQKFSAQDKKRFDNAMKMMLGERAYQFNKKNILFPDYYPAIRNIYIQKNNVYVITWKKKDDKTEVFIFDLKGKGFKKVYLKVDEVDAIHLSPYAFYEGKFYQLVDNEEKESWELHTQKID